MDSRECLLDFGFHANNGFAAVGVAQSRTAVAGGQEVCFGYEGAEGGGGAGVGADGGGEGEGGVDVGELGRGEAGGEGCHW